MQKSVLRLSRGSSAKRTAKEIVEFEYQALVDNADRLRLNDKVMKERDHLIKYNKAFMKKHQRIPRTTLEFYKPVKLIGEGAFGQVTLSIHMLTGRYVAIKAIKKSFMADDHSRAKVMQEVQILKNIRHSNIIRLFEVFESPSCFCLVMEYAGGGDLLQYVKKHKRLAEETSKNIFK
jgi:serine/threonine protein kinase